jgi:hypothetical protein
MHRWRWALRLLAWWPLAACTPDYPMDKPGTWNVPANTLGSNDTNLRVMLVDPHDLIQGASADGSEGTEAATPVRKLVTGHRPALPNMDASTVDTSGGQSSGSAGVAGTNGSTQTQ